MDAINSGVKFVQCENEAQFFYGNVRCEFLANVQDKPWNEKNQALKSVLEKVVFEKRIITPNDYYKISKEFRFNPSEFAKLEKIFVEAQKNNEAEAASLRSLEENQRMEKIKGMDLKSNEIKLPPPPVVIERGDITGVLPQPPSFLQNQAVKSIRSLPEPMATLHPLPAKVSSSVQVGRKSID